MADWYRPDRHRPLPHAEQHRVEARIGQGQRVADGERRAPPGRPPQGAALRPGYRQPAQMVADEHPSPEGAESSGGSEDRQCGHRPPAQPQHDSGAPEVRRLLDAGHEGLAVQALPGPERRELDPCHAVEGHPQRRDGQRQHHVLGGPDRPRRRGQQDGEQASEEQRQQGARLHPAPSLLRPPGHLAGQEGRDAVVEGQQTGQRQCELHDAQGEGTAVPRQEDDDADTRRGTEARTWPAAPSSWRAPSAPSGGRPRGRIPTAARWSCRGAEHGRGDGHPCGP